MKTFKEYLIEQSTKQTKQESVVETKPKVECDMNGICDVIRSYESKGNEEKILSVYLDSKKLPTIGHGHLITKNSENIFAETFPEEHKQNPKFGKTILSGKGKLTPEQAETLLRRDVQTRLPLVKKLAPEFESYSPKLQGELYSETFRGMATQSPKAMAFLRAGKFEEAANEYLNADEYRTAVKEKSGIATRMKNLSDALRMEGQARKKAAASKTNQESVGSSTSQTAPSR